MRRTNAAWLLVVGLLFTIGCKGGTLPGGGGTKPAGGTSASTVDAVKLCTDYKDGQSTADSHYKGKDIEVHGKVLNTRPDPATKAKFVVLKGTDGAGSRNVRCYMAPDQAAEVDKLKAGDDVKVKGTCEGKMGTSTGDTFDVEMKNCKLVK